MQRIMVSALLGIAVLIAGSWTSPSVVRAVIETQRFDKSLLFDNTILVKYKETFLKSTKPEKRQAEMDAIVKGLLPQHDIDVQVTQTLPILGVQLLRLGNDQLLDSTIRTLRNNPVVEYAEYNYRIEGEQSVPPRDPDDPQWGAGGFWGLRKIGMRNAWGYQTDASRIIVAIIDSGIDYEHPDIAPNMWTDLAGLHGYNHCTNTGDPKDTMGHGTLVGGVIGARGNNTLGAVGTGWQVQLLALKALCRTDSGVPTGGVAQAVAAIDYAISKRAHIINNSWRVIPPIDASEIQTLLYAVKRTNCIGAGTPVNCVPALFVAAAGNGRPDESLNSNASNGKVYPASFGANPYYVGNVIAVAATECKNPPTCTDYSIWDNSHYGSKTVHIAAPGASIDSTFLWDSTSPDSSYSSLDGTSMAAPHVSGCAALLQARKLSATNRLLSIKELKYRLLLKYADTPFKDDTRRPINGRSLNCARAMATLPSPDTTPPPAPINLTFK